ncbi:RNA polymerase II transcription factor B subunit 1 [Nowakowskiella sp. JEL0407]|nr:RNA polymerase II transcription factor B subunit 1 [Nowakowskiella sp. JEL0407]
MQFQVVNKKKDGLLRLSSNGIVWLTTNSTSPDLEIPYTSIKSQLKNTPKNGRVILKLITQSADPSNPSVQKEFSHSFQFDGKTAEQDRTRVSEFIAQQMAKALQRASHIGKEEVVDGDTLKARKVLLEQNEELRRLFEELVGCGLISETEFWKSRKQMLLNQTFKDKQKEGKASTLEIIRPTGNDTNIKYTLTPDIVYSIFVQYPAVRAAYDANVPDKLSATEFWTRYFKSEYFHKSRPGKNVPVDKSKADDLFTKYLSVDEDDTQPFPKKTKLGVSHKLIDLTAFEGDIHETFGNKKDFTMIPGKQKQSLSLIRTFNRHAETVVKSKRNNFLSVADENGKDAELSAAKADEIFLKETELTDLELPETSKTIDLRIQDSSHYFKNQNAPTQQLNPSNLSKVRLDSLDVDCEQEIFDAFRREVSNWVPNLEKVCLVSLKFGKYLTGSIVKNRRVKGPANYTKLNEVVTQDCETAQEFLRHFWSAITGPTSIEKSAKAERLIVALRGVETRINNAVKKLEPKERAVAESLISGLMKSIAHAYIKYGEKVSNN